MLESIIKRFRGIVLGLIIFGLSAIFVIQFGGPQSQGCNPSGVTYAAEVYGDHISPTDFQAAYVLAGGDRYPPQLAKQNRLRELVLYGLVERALLAREARKLGYEVTEDDVMQKLAEDGVMYVSMSSSAPPYLPSGPRRFDFSGQDGEFDDENLRNFIQYRLGRSIREFTRSQIEETLAQRMREAITGSVTVSDAEVWDAYVREQDKVTLGYVRFSPVYYRDRIEVTDEKLSAWMKEHQAQVDEEYEKNKHRYTGLEKQVRARHILVKVDSDASEEAKAEARARAEKLLQRARGGEGFAALAREHSEDEGSARKGGDLGYNPRGRMVAAFDAAQFSLEPGQISDLVETRYGFHIIRVEGVREGDVPVEEAKAELAERLYRESQADALAKQAAEEMLVSLRSGTSLEALGETLGGGAAAEGAEDGGKGSDDPLAPEVRETQAFGRTDTPIPGPFDSTPLVRHAFELSEETPLPEAPLRMGDDYFVYRLKERTRATRESFDAETEQQLHQRLLSAKQQEALKVHVQRLLARAQQAEEVAVNTALLSYEEEAS